MKGIIQQGPECALVTLAVLADKPLDEIKATIAPIIEPYPLIDVLTGRDQTVETKFWQCLNHACDKYGLPFALYTSSYLPNQHLIPPADESKVELIRPVQAIPACGRGAVHLALDCVISIADERGRVMASATIPGGLHIVPFENGLCYDGNDTRDLVNGPQGETLHELKSRYSVLGGSVRVLVRVLELKAIRS